MSARLFVGCNVDGLPRWGITDVMNVLSMVLPNATYTWGKGTYNGVSEDTIVVEVFPDEGEVSAKFHPRMVRAAQAAVRDLQQEVVLLEYFGELERINDKEATWLLQSM